MIAIQRYETLDTIATGHCAVVYRAHDRALGREVVIKQIHSQFLADERQLARYWQEAQLLASLQHPNIVTIYDVVRPRGWLVLERMQTTLTDQLQGEGIDVDYLRMVLVDCLEALRFLHANGVIHGDVKPSNLLTDAGGRVKLGDFGLARRANDENGSLLKGTTKYMAPEVASDQFGPVGPASDLYSLGIVAYELLCGARFETLFPGMSMFGHDMQIAWMMWHTAPDRRLPEIGRIMEGVPEDVANVIQRLVIKDPTRRYQSADEVLEYLRSMASPKESPDAKDREAEAARLAVARKNRWRRYGAAVVMILSLFLSVAMAIPEKSPPPIAPAPPSEGVIVGVYPDQWRLAMTDTTGTHAVEMELARCDRIFVNDCAGLLRDVQRHDHVQIKAIHDESGRRILEVHAIRPVEDKGHIKELQSESGQVTLVLDEGARRGRELLMEVPPTTLLALNGQTKLHGQSITLGSLRPNDHLTVRHLGKEARRVAIEIDAYRTVTSKGILRDVEAKQSRLAVAIHCKKNEELMLLPWATDCKVTLNGLGNLNGRQLGPTDLRVGDKVTLIHDTHIRRADAYRVFTVAGVIHGLQQISRTVELIPDGGGKAKTVLVPAKCKIELDGEEVEWNVLRTGDHVELSYDNPDGPIPEALHVSTRRFADPERWALLIGIQRYDDRSIKPPHWSVADAVLLRNSLVKRYRVPISQAVLMTDENRIRTQEGTKNLFDRINQKGRLVVYFAGSAYQESDGNVILAAKDVDRTHLTATGIPLQWLVDELEKCRAKEKLLLLDAYPSTKESDKSPSLSTGEMIKTLKASPDRSPLRTITAVASCRAGQRGLADPRHGQGLFAWSLAEGFSGKADTNFDNRLETTELFAFLQKTMAVAAAGFHAQQAPELILPDNRPPRLSEEAKQAIRILAAKVHQNRVELSEASNQYKNACKLAGSQPEPKILYGLVLLRAKDRDAAFRVFEQLKKEQPDLAISWQANAWLRFEKRAYASGIQELIGLTAKIPKPCRPSDRYSDDAQEMFSWIGQMREFAASAVPESQQPSPAVLTSLDAAIGDCGRQAEQCYQQGRRQTQAVLDRFAHDAALAEDGAAIAKIKVDRRQLVHYASFPMASITEHCLAGLDR